MNCPYCGDPLREGVHFCGNCGADLSKVSGQQSQTLRDSLEAREAQPTPAQRPMQQPARPQQPMQQPTQPQPAQATGSFQPVAQTQRMPQAQPSPQAGPQGYPQPAQPYQQAPQQPAQQMPQQPYPPASQQPYQPAPQQPNPQMPQGYNAPVGNVPQPPQKSGLPTWAKVAIGVVGAVVVAGVALAASGVLGASGGAGDGTESWTTSGPMDPGSGTPAYELVESYRDETFGYSFMMPADPVQSSESGEGEVNFYWGDPELSVYAYVQANNGSDATEVGEWLAEDYDATVEDTGSDYVVARSESGEDEVNYTLVYVTDNSLQFLDIYYSPEDDAALRPVALEMIQSFVPGAEEDFAVDMGDTVPVEIGDELFTEVAEGTQVVDDTYGCSVTAVDGGFGQMPMADGSVFLSHGGPSLYISCYGMDDAYEGLEQAYEAFVSKAASDVECSEALYDEDAGWFAYTETGSESVASYKVYVTDDAVQVFVAMYDRDDVEAEVLAAAMAETFQPGVA